MNKKLQTVVQKLHLFRFGNPYQNRKVAQATVYILQQMGLDMGYDDYEMKVCGLHSNKLSIDMTETFPVATLSKKEVVTKRKSL